MARDWSPESRAAFGDRMRQVAATRKTRPKPANGASATTTTEPAAATDVPNPIATDVVEPTPIRKPPKPRPPVPPPPPEPDPGEPPPNYSTADLISRLESIPLATLPYADCGLLLNALSACSTAVALARRQKQEQLEAGTHRAPCKTCGRMIDISKAGGFQILTERDEFHMPRNSFYCSQSCVLARNMPSHAKQTSREKKENQA